MNAAERRERRHEIALRAEQPSPPCSRPKLQLVPSYERTLDRADMVAIARAVRRATRRVPMKIRADVRDDLRQDVAIALWRHPRPVRNVEAWALTAARNRLAALTRDEANRRGLLKDKHKAGKPLRRGYRGKMTWHPPCAGATRGAPFAERGAWLMHVSVAQRDPYRAEDLRHEAIDDPPEVPPLDPRATVDPVRGSAPGCAHHECLPMPKPNVKNRIHTPVACVDTHLPVEADEKSEYQ